MVSRSRRPGRPVRSAHRLRDVPGGHRRPVVDRRRPGRRSVSPHPWDGDPLQPRVGTRGDAQGPGRRRLRYRPGGLRPLHRALVGTLARPSHTSTTTRCSRPSVRTSSASPPRTIAMPARCWPRSRWTSWPPLGEEADRIVAAAKAAGTKIDVNYTRRWMPEWVEARRLVRQGAIGPLSQIVAVVGGPRAMLFRNHTHVIDLIHSSPNRRPSG